MRIPAVFQTLCALRRLLGLFPEGFPRPGRPYGGAQPHRNRLQCPQLVLVVVCTVCRCRVQANLSSCVSLKATATTFATHSHPQLAVPLSLTAHRFEVAHAHGLSATLVPSLTSYTPLQTATYVTLLALFAHSFSSSPSRRASRAKEHAVVAGV